MDLIKKLREENHIIPLTIEISDYLEQTYKYAAKHSPDLSTKNAAMILHNPSKKIIAFGANTFPKNIQITKERLSNRPDKYYFTEHAERMTISNAYNSGFLDFENATMICPWYACHDCGRAIINSGLKNVIGHLSPLIWDQNIAQKKGQPDWAKSIMAAFEMFDESGVNYFFAEGDLYNTIENLHSGKIVNA